MKHAWGRVSRLLLLLGAVAAPLVSAPAHHGGIDRYDSSRPINLRGVVTKATFAPPHPILTLLIDTVSEPPALTPAETADFTGAVVVRAEDSGATRTIEFAPIGMFFNLSGRVVVGERVEVIAHAIRAFAKSIRDRGWGLLDHRELIPTFPETTRASKGKSPFSLSVEIIR